VERDTIEDMTQASGSLELNRETLCNWPWSNFLLLSFLTDVHLAHQNLLSRSTKFRGVVLSNQLIHSGRILYNAVVECSSAIQVTLEDLLSDSDPCPCRRSN